MFCFTPFKPPWKGRRTDSDGLWGGSGAEGGAGSNALIVTSGLMKAGPPRVTVLRTGKTTLRAKNASHTQIKSFFDCPSIAYLTTVSLIS